MTNNTEKTQEDIQPESVEKNNGLKKLTIYTLFISISCLLIAGVWYKKDEIPFAAIFETTVVTFDKVTSTVTDGYSTIVNYLSDNNSDDQLATKTKDTQATKTIENHEVVVTNTDDEIKTVVDTEIASKNVIVTEQEINADINIIKSEKSSETEQPVVITNKESELVETEKAPTEALPETKPVDFTVTEEKGNEVAISEAHTTEKLIVIENTVTEFVAEKNAPTDVTKEAETLKVSSVIKDVPSPAAIQPSTHIRHSPNRQTSGVYTRLPYQYYAPAPVMMQNTMTQNNFPPANTNLAYMNQGNFIEQQQRAFEQNMKIQQQMMQQAFRMQSAIFKDAHRRHQEMIKRAANWKADSQKNHERFNNRLNYQPAYMY